jgi:hypothetical protein
MNLDDKAITCSCSEFVRLKPGTSIPKKGSIKLGEGYHFVQIETCVSKNLYATGVYEEGSVLDIDSAEDCEYKESSN